MAKIVLRDGRRITADEVNINVIDRFIKARGGGFHFFVPFENLAFVVFPDQESRELQLEREGEQ